MPVCIKCKEEKTEDQFRKSSRAKSGLEGKCKECRVTPPKAPNTKAQFKWRTEGTICSLPEEKSDELEGCAILKRYPNFKKCPVSTFCYKCMKVYKSMESNHYVVCPDCSYGLDVFPCDCCKRERQYFEFPLASTCFQCKVEAEGVVPVMSEDEKEEEPEIPVGEE
jgi:hypothetical protein